MSNFGADIFDDEPTPPVAPPPQPEASKPRVDRVQEVDLASAQRVHDDVRDVVFTAPARPLPRAKASAPAEIAPTRPSGQSEQGPPPRQSETEPSRRERPWRDSAPAAGDDRPPAESEDRGSAARTRDDRDRRDDREDRGARRDRHRNAPPDQHRGQRPRRDAFAEDPRDVMPASRQRSIDDGGRDPEDQQPPDQQPVDRQQVDRQVGDDAPSRRRHDDRERTPAPIGERHPARRGPHPDQPRSQRDAQRPRDREKAPPIRTATRERVAVFVDLDALVAAARTGGRELAYRKLLRALAGDRRIERAVCYLAENTPAGPRAALAASGFELRPHRDGDTVGTELLAEARQFVDRVDVLVVAPLHGAALDLAAMPRRAALEAGGFDGNAPSGTLPRRLGRECLFVP